MKYVIVLGDGMADEPIEAIGNTTPLEHADTPTLDKLAKKAEIGTVNNVPKGMKPGSDTANLSVMGYNPEIYYTGRSPLEALSIGVDMKETDIAFRANIVTLSEDEPYEEKTIIDHSSSEISTEDAAILLDAVRKEFENDVYKFYVGTSYRHLLIWDKGQIVETTPPHDILTKVVKDYLPEDEVLRDMMKRSYDILSNHPLNIKRKEQGLNPANSLWFWGAGTRPMLSSFVEKNNKKGVMISAVDLLKGIAVGAGLTNLIVEGATGGLETNYEGKADAAIKALLEDDYDFAYILVEAPDEMGHQGSLERKLKAVEYLDKRLIKRVCDAFDNAGVDYRIAVLPDHPTPVCVRSHTANPVPYLLYDSTKDLNKGGIDWTYCEKCANNSDNLIPNGYELIDKLFEK